MNIPFPHKPLCLAMAVLALTACGGGGGGSSAPAATQITGTASKGAFEKAIVTAFKVNADGSKGDRLKEARTDADGKYTLDISGYAGPVLLEMTADAETLMKCDVPAGCGVGVAFGQKVAAGGLSLSAVLPTVNGGVVKSAITPYTHLAAEFARSQTGALTKANIEKALTQIQDLFDLPDLATTQPADATKLLPAGDLDAQRYALMNAAIGQLGGGTIAGVQDRLNKLADQIRTRGGQLRSSEAGADTVVDLADVLAAAQAVQGAAGGLQGLNDLIKAALAERLAAARDSTGDTQAEASTNAGTTELAKAKAFAKSVGKFADNLRALDNANLDSVLRDRVQTLDTMADAHGLISAALGASLAVMGEAVMDDTLEGALAKADVQALLDDFVNDNAMKVTAGNGVTLAIDRANRTVTLNGNLTVQPLTVNYVLSGGVWIPRTVNDGSPMTFTVTGLKLTYPSDTVATTTHELIIAAGGKIASTDLQFSFPAGTDSRMQVVFATAKSLEQRDAAEEEEIPNSVLIRLDNVELKALKAPADEFSRFVGRAEWKVVKSMLDKTHGTGQRAWPMPDTTSLKGTFSSGAGDVMEAAVSLTYAGSNPRISPEEGHVRAGLFKYRFDAVAKAAYLTANTGYFGGGWFDQVTSLRITQGSNGCLTGTAQNAGVNPPTYWLGCYGQSTVPASLKAMADSGWIPYPLQAQVEKEGGYGFPSTLNFSSASEVTVNGVLVYSNEDLAEDATHFARPVLSLTTKIKLPGTAVDVEASITAKRTAYKGGEFTATLRQGADKLTITSPVVGGEPAISLTNLDGVKVDVDLNETGDRMAIRLNGKELGWIYTLNGLPVARFTDNSLMAL